MFRELEDAKDAKNAHEGKAATAFSTFAVALRLLDRKNYEVREDRQHVYDVHYVLTEVFL